jgi:hypothetical protein
MTGNGLGMLSSERHDIHCFTQKSFHLLEFFKESRDFTGLPMTWKATWDL